MIALASSQAINLAMGSGFVCKETISRLLSKANMQAQSLNSKINPTQ
jgi:hypothetical protein